MYVLDVGSMPHPKFCHSPAHIQTYTEIQFGQCGSDWIVFVVFVLF